MNIVHINTAWSWGGGEEQTRCLIKGLQLTQVACLLIAQPNSPLAVKAKEEKIPLCEIRMKGEWDVLAVLKLKRILEKLQPDILHLHTAHAHTLGLVSGRLAKARKIIATRRMDNPLSTLSSRVKYNKTDRIVAISEAVKDILVKNGVRQDKITVICSAVNCQDLSRKSNLRQELPLPQDYPLLGTVANLVKRKAHTYLFYAMVKVKERFPKIRLLVVGEGPLEEELKSLAQKLDLQNEVIFLGFRKDIPGILSILDVFVLASLKEGLGVSLLEASGLGLPVVATNVGGIPEVVKDGVTGLLVPPRNSELLAEKIIYLLSHPQHARKMGENGKKWVEDNFSASKMVNDYVNLYEDVLQEKKHSK